MVKILVHETMVHVFYRLDFHRSVFETWDPASKNDR